jgi:hypothetical protein
VTLYIRKNFASFSITLFALALMLALPCQSKAQTTNGSIVGTVTDSSGAAVPEAAVTVTNLGTSELRSIKSDSAGNYSVVNLLPANYKVTVEAANFKRIVRQPVTVAVGATVRIDTILQVGATSETVEVSTQAPLLQTDSGSLSTQVEGQTVTEMPLNGRNTMNLIELAAGVVPQGSTSGSSGMNQLNQAHTNPSGWNNYSIGGSMAGESSVYTDGVPDNYLGGNNIGMILTQDAVQEFNVVSNSMTADFGRNGGGVINMATKSGSNKFSGTAYEYLRNSFFNANEFFNKSAELAKRAAGLTNPATGALISNKPLKWNQNQYGVAYGGPVKKDKIFFHFTWEAYEALLATAQPGYVPTVNQQNGITSTPIIDPGAATFVAGNGSTQTGAGFSSCNISTTANPGYYTITNLWSAGCGDPLAKIIRGYYPSPTPGYNVNGNNFYIAPGGKETQQQYNGRADYVLSSKQRLFARYTYWQLMDHGQALFGENGGWKTANSTSHNISQQAVLGDTYTISPQTVLDVRLSYLRDYSPNSVPEALGTDETSKFPGTYLAAVANQMSAQMLPKYTFQGGLNYVSQGHLSSWNQDIFNTYAIDAGLVHIQGNHNLKYGAELRKMSDNDIGNGPGLNSGAFTYTGGFTGDQWTDFLLGYVQNANGSSNGSIGLGIENTSYSYYQAYYVTDSWQATHRLTLTIGLRYELPGGIFTRGDINTILQPSAQWTTSGGVPVTGLLALVNSPLYSDRSSINVRHEDFGPRVGFAYRIGNNSAVRGGYGLSYLAVDTKNGSMSGSSPVTENTTYCGSPNSTSVAGTNYYIPSPTQMMYNCFGPASVTLNGTTYSGNNPVIAPPQRTYNGGALVTYLGQLNNTGKSLSGAVPNQKNPYVQQWNLSISHQMGDLMLEIGYAGTKGTHLPALGSNYNQIPDSVWLGQGSAVTSALTQKAYCAKTQTTITVGQCDRPYPWYGNVSDSVAYLGSSIYHAMQIKAEKRFHSGGVVMANYTWAKTIGDTDSTVGSYLEWGSGVGGSGGGIQDYNNMKAERSVMHYDVPQRAVISYVLTLPFGQGQKWANNTTGIVSHAISGWGINGITTFQHGFHLGFTDSTVNSGSAQNNQLGSFGFGALRPTYTPGCSKMSGITGGYASRVIAQTPQFNRSCWSQPNPWTPGSEPRVDNSLFSQGIDNFDFSAMKSTKITERINIEFRAEFFNLFNRIQFAPPATAFGQMSGNTNDLGLVFQTANNPRLVQFSLRANF